MLWSWSDLISNGPVGQQGWLVLTVLLVPWKNRSQLAAIWAFISVKLFFWTVVIKWRNLVWEGPSIPSAGRGTRQTVSGNLNKRECWTGNTAGAEQRSRNWSPGWVRKLSDPDFGSGTVGSGRWRCQRNPPIVGIRCPRFIFIVPSMSAFVTLSSRSPNG